jgi:hypothetical protein
MKSPRPDPRSEIREALGDPFDVSDAAIDSFLSRYDAGEIDMPAMPPHLLPAPLARTVARGLADASRHREIADECDSLKSLAIAARNGDEALSDETLRKMMEAQDQEDEL